MTEKLTPYPGKDPWMTKLARAVNDLISTPVTVTTTDGLTGAQRAALTGGGDTSLHFHSADRSRANHTGTQTSSTISDFTTAVNSLISANSATTSGTSSDILAAQVFGG